MNIKKALLISFASLLMSMVTVAHAGNLIQQIRSSSTEDKVQIVVDTTQPPNLNAFALSNPLRLVVDIKGEQARGFLNNLGFKNRGVSTVRMATKENGKFRLVMELADDFRWKAYAAPPQGNDGHRVIINVYDNAGKTADVGAPNIASPYLQDTPTSYAAIDSDNYNDNFATTSDEIQLEAQTVIGGNGAAPIISGLSDNDEVTTDMLVNGMNLRSDNISESQVHQTAVPAYSNNYTTTDYSSSYTEQPALPNVQPLNDYTGINSVASTIDAQIQSQLPPSVAGSATQPTTQPMDSLFQNTLNSNTYTYYTEKSYTPPNVSDFVDSDINNNYINSQINYDNQSDGTTVDSSSSFFNAPPKRYRDLLVMIDPGHGGKDPGAIGPARTREKDVVLQIAKRLKRQIDALPGMRAMLTRSDDRYITLRGRIEIARKKKADLFVSIHADGATNRAAKGSSVYVLSNRGASSEAAKILAQNENAVDAKYNMDIAGVDDDVGNVLIKMQQDATIERSHILAKTTLRQLKGIGAVHKRLVERAGFAVLKSPHIPSMLVETAFISNSEEELKLRDPQYQEQLAIAIASGIKNFFDSHATQTEMVANATSKSHSYNN